MTTGVKRPTGRQEVVDALLDAASRLVDANRPDEVSLRGIAREAGVNHGLVYRHFGTRDDLIDRLLERNAAQWTAQLEDKDYRGALQSIFGISDPAEESAGPWLRLLAWSLLTESPEKAGEAHKRYATLDRLPPLLRDDDPGSAFATAAALSLIFGWKFFHPYIRASLHIEDVEFAELQDVMRGYVERIVEQVGDRSTSKTQAGSGPATGRRSARRSSAKSGD